MKKGLLSTVLLVYSTHIIGKGPQQPEQSQTQPQPQVVYVPVPVTDPIERDKMLDNALFGQFMSILGNFCHVLIDRHDTQKVTQHVGHIINDVVTTAHILTRSGYAKEDVEMLKKMIHQIIALLALKYEQQKLISAAA